MAEMNNKKLNDQNKKRRKPNYAVLPQNKVNQRNPENLKKKYAEDIKKYNDLSYYERTPANSYTRPARKPIMYTSNYRRRKSNRLRAYFGRFILFAVVFLIFAAVFALFFYLNLTKSTRPEDFTFEYKLDGEKIHTEKAPFETVFYDGQYFFPLDFILSRLNYTVTGGGDEYSFISAATGEYIQFKVGSNILYINDVEYHMGAACFIHGGILFAPLNFLQNNFSGLQISRSEDKENYFILDMNKDTALLFKLRPLDVHEPVEDTGNLSAESMNFEFIADLSEYEQYFSPENPDEFILLINTANPLDPIDYVPPDLHDVEATRTDREKTKMRFIAAKALEGFFIEMRANGITDVSVTSAYRSYNNQKSIFNNAVATLMQNNIDRESAEAQASISYQRPGHSEHQSGLAVDMHSLPVADSAFGDTEAAKWMEQNAHKFGFILRYKPEKTEITGIKYEPWHFRYVGRYHATRMYELDMCLEEYTDYLNRN